MNYKTSISGRATSCINLQIKDFSKSKFLFRHAKKIRPRLWKMQSSYIYRDRYTYIFTFYENSSIYIFIFTFIALVQGKREMKNH